MSRKVIEVVAGFIRRGDRFLICRRPMHKARGGQWEFAGGKVEAGESLEQALAREFREELDLELKVEGVVAAVTHEYPDLTVNLSLLEAVALSEEVRLLEHSDARWVTLAQVYEFDLCPADRELVRLLEHRYWRMEEEAAHIHGWDFSHIQGRYGEEEDLPWSYRDAVNRYRRQEHRLLDLDTGGGEFLLSLGHPHANTAATEGYEPNVALCRELFAPLGVDFRTADAGGKLPFEDESFDLVINRHGSFNPSEIRRVLKPGGIFVTQQVGAKNDRELVELLLPGAPEPYPDQTLGKVSQRFMDCGFEILEAQEAFRPIHFYDVGALVWFARIIEWEFPGFSVDKCRERLDAAQQLLLEKGSIDGSIHRFLIAAQKK